MLIFLLSPGWWGGSVGKFDEKNGANGKCFTSHALRVEGMTIDKIYSVYTPTIDEYETAMESAPA